MRRVMCKPITADELICRNSPRRLDSSMAETSPTHLLLRIQCHLAVARHLCYLCHKTLVNSEEVVCVVRT